MPRVTISALAGQLGLSKAAVSYALNGQPGISEVNRGRVLELAAELGWYPSSSARALSHARASVIGIVLSREPEMIGSEPYYMSVLAGIESVLSSADMSLLLRMTGSSGGADLAVYRRWDAERRVDGVILFDQTSPDPRLEVLAGLGLPFVLHGASEDTAGMAASTVDQSRDAMTLVQHLQSLGHRRIAYFCGPLSLVHEVRRREAVFRFAAEAGIEVLASQGDYTFESARVQTAQWLDTMDRPTAIVYGNDLMAMGGMAALRASGAVVPDDVSVMSWDDSIFCRISTPQVTALARDPEEQGKASARLLLSVIAGHAITSVPLGEGALVRRESTAAATR
ncbi:MAG: LacI family transcriptional regulator [Acidobacteria bacterium]|nr:LacI family transcriptional regulator [Acidobacteriota bacterium]